jgi:hypothetical protein
MSTFVRVLLTINNYDVKWKDLVSQELDAIVSEIRKMWPADLNSRIWFDVEMPEKYVNGRWETVAHVVCYHLPDKSQRAEIPREYVLGLVGRKIRIFPIVNIVNDATANSAAHFRRLEMQLVEVTYILE